MPVTPTPPSDKHCSYWPEAPDVKLNIMTRVGRQAGRGCTHPAAELHAATLSLLSLCQHAVRYSTAFSARLTLFTESSPNPSVINKPYDSSEKRLAEQCHTQENNSKETLKLSARANNNLCMKPLIGIFPC